MTIREAYEETKGILTAGGIEDAAQEARLLLCHFLKIAPADIYLLAQRKIGESGTLILQCAKKRKSHYPLQYILGEWPFMGLSLSLGEGVLIPRDDTEILVRSIAKMLRVHNRPRGLDLCAGTGAVGLGICAMHPQASVEAIELYPEAYSFLTKNCRAHAQFAVAPIQGDITDSVFCSHFQDAHYDFIASNPPYVTGEEMQALQPEIGHEPSSALLAGENGLFFYRKITELWTAKLAPGGILAVEIGETQATAVCALFHRAGLSSVSVHRDLAGHDRCVIGVVL